MGPITSPIGLYKPACPTEIMTAALQARIDQIEAQTQADMQSMQAIFDNAARQIKQIPNGRHREGQVTQIAEQTADQLEAVNDLIRDAGAQLDRIFSQMSDRPATKLKRDKYKLVRTKLTTCSICLDTSPINEGLRCGHAFHKACIIPWIRVNTIRGKFSCPNCRKQNNIE